MPLRRASPRVFVVLGMILPILALGWEKPDKRSPGEPEHRQAASGKYCPKCGEPLEPKPGYFWCDEHGVIGKAQADISSSGKGS